MLCGRLWVACCFVDHFRNDVINRQEYYVIPDMLAKTLAEVLSNEMDSARAISELQKSASEEELLATLQRVTEQRLKLFCNESAVKSSGIKARNSLVPRHIRHFISGDIKWRMGLGTRLRKLGNRRTLDHELE